MDYQTARHLLIEGTYGVLATVGADGMPYGVPLSYIAEGHRLYFHGADHGHKLKNLAHNPRATFTVIANVEMSPAQYTILYRSVIAFGEVHTVTDPEEKRAVMQKVCTKYGAPVDPVHIGAALPRTAVLCMEVEYLSGRENA